MKTVKFYNICIDAAAVEARGDGPLKKLIDDIGGWNVTGNMKPLSAMSITQRIGKVTSELFTKPFIDVKVFFDPHDSNKHILQVSWCPYFCFAKFCSTFFFWQGWIYLQHKPIAVAFAHAIFVPFKLICRIEYKSYHGSSCTQASAKCVYKTVKSTFDLIWYF